MIIVWQFQLASTPDIESTLPLVVFTASRTLRTVWTMLRWPNTHSETERNNKWRQFVVVFQLIRSKMLYHLITSPTQ